jgi:two-component system sensor kinase FixL
MAARHADGLLEVDVSDTGVGIAPDMQARVMEPLFSTKARGLGLGLAIARAILEKNQGGLRLRSELGVGTTFTVTLRAAVGGTPPPPEEGNSS